MVDADFEKPVPSPTPWSIPFWQAAKEERFLLKHCVDCGHIDHPPYPTCTECGSDAYEWREASGKATLMAYAVNSYGVSAPFVEDLPYVLVIVRLAEGPRMISNLVGVDQGDIENGMELEVCFEVLNDEFTLPKWTRAT